MSQPAHRRRSAFTQPQLLTLAAGSAVLVFGVIWIATWIAAGTDPGSRLIQAIGSLLILAHFPACERLRRHTRNSGAR